MSLAHILRALTNEIDPALRQDARDSRAKLNRAIRRMNKLAARAEELTENAPCPEQQKPKPQPASERQ